jgi:hypothetical protein
MATRKKASSSGKVPAKSAKKPAARGVRRRTTRAATGRSDAEGDDPVADGEDEGADPAAIDSASADGADDSDDADGGAVAGRGSAGHGRNDERGADFHDAATGAGDADDGDDDPLPPPRRRAVQRDAGGMDPPAPPLRSPTAPLNRAVATTPVPAPPARAASSSVSSSTMPPVRAGSRPFVVARGEDAGVVFGETLRHSGFYEAVENAQIKSGKRRELFEVACKVDFMRGVRREAEPVSYVDPRLVAQLFNGLLDRGFRILRVVETRNELSRYLANRSVRQVGNALGYDESCYELKDLADELVPLDVGGTGKRPTGRLWKQADFRIVFAKARTDEHWGPPLVLWNLWHVLTTSDLMGVEQGWEPGDLALTLLEKMPVHFALIDAVHVRDGAAGAVFPWETLRTLDPAAPTAAMVHRPGTVIAGSDPLAVEAAGHKLQGLDPLADPMCLRKLRKLTGWKAPAESEALPTFRGWRGVGAKIREVLGADKPSENLRLALLGSLQDADARLFPPLASAWFAIRLRQKVAAFVEETRRRLGVGGGGVEFAGGPPEESSSMAEGDGGDDGNDDGDGPDLPDDDDPPTFH